jgi:hypothetical protein
MFSEAGLSLDMACSAATPSDIQWMVRAGYGLALPVQGAALDSELTTRQIAGVNWTDDTAFIHHAEADHIALPFIIRSLQRTLKRTLRKKVVSQREDGPVQLDLLA